MGDKLADLFFFCFLLLVLSFLISHDFETGRNNHHHRIIIIISFGIMNDIVST
ncbi:Uncharacterised protein [Chlamydia trachomatis]|nr:Uncharacterised protein [Chlamydia trachomatis]